MWTSVPPATVAVSTSAPTWLAPSGAPARPASGWTRTAGPAPVSARLPPQESLSSQSAAPPVPGAPTRLPGWLDATSVLPPTMGQAGGSAGEGAGWTGAPGQGVIGAPGWSGFFPVQVREGTSFPGLGSGSGELALLPTPPTMLRVPRAPWGLGVAGVGCPLGPEPSLSREVGSGVQLGTSQGERHTAGAAVGPGGGAQALGPEEHRGAVGSSPHRTRGGRASGSLVPPPSPGDARGGPGRPAAFPAASPAHRRAPGRAAPSLPR